MVMALGMLVGSILSFAIFRDKHGFIFTIGMSFGAFALAATQMYSQIPPSP